jgi:hypothetical protein
MDNNLIINGYRVTKVSDSVLQIGCTFMTIYQLRELRTFMNYYGGEYIKEGRTWTSVEVNQLMDAFDGYPTPPHELDFTNKV